MVGLIITWVVFLIGILVLAVQINKLEGDIISLALAVAKDFQQAQDHIITLEEKVKALEEEKND